MTRYAPSTQDLASRDVESRSMTQEVLEGRVAVIKEFIFIYNYHIYLKKLFFLRC